MKNIFLIPTDKSSKLSINCQTGLLQLGLNNRMFHDDINIYITSDEEIKDGDWFLDDNNQISRSYRLSHVQFANPKKIILTTDQDLIKDDVQAIDDEFLEWFVKNPSCEYVDVKYNYVCSNCNEDKNNPKYQTCHGNYRTHKIFKIIIPKEEPKQETLEEAYNRIFDNKLDRVLKAGFIAGAKWKAEKMYSEEEVKEILFHRETHYIETGHHLHIEEWFEQFKKK